MSDVKNIPVKLKRKYWTGKGVFDKTTQTMVEPTADVGEIIMVTREEAMRLIERNMAERADPLP